MGEPIKVSKKVFIGEYIAQAAEHIEKYSEVKLTGLNSAMQNVVLIAENLKLHIANLNQQNEFLQCDDGKEARIQIILSLNALNPTHKGFQPPIPINQVVPKSFEELKQVPVKTRKYIDQQDPIKPKRGKHKTDQIGRGASVIRSQSTDELDPTSDNITENRPAIMEDPGQQLLINQPRCKDLVIGAGANISIILQFAIDILQNNAELNLQGAISAYNTALQILGEVSMQIKPVYHIVSYMTRNSDIGQQEQYFVMKLSKSPLS